MRLRATDAPYWYGREYTRTDLVSHVSCHRIIRFTTIRSHFLPVHQLALLTSGHMDLQLNKKTVRLSAGEFTVIPARTMISSESGTRTCQVFWIGVNPLGRVTFPKMSEPLVEELHELERRIQDWTNQVGKASAALIAAAEHCFELAHTRETSVALCTGAALNLLGALARSMQGSTAEDLDAQTLIKPALELIQNRHATELRIEALAQACRMSKTTFNKLFHRATGLPPREFINRQRIEDAAQMLRENRLSVREVANATGFISPQYFHTSFKKYFGCRPGEFRKTQVATSRD